MYRTVEEIIPNSAEAFCQIAKDKIEEKSRKARERSEKDIAKIVKHCLNKIASAAKNGEYWIYYEYSPSIIDRILFWQTPLWNNVSRELLKIKLEEMGFNCRGRSDDICIAWSKAMI